MASQASFLEFLVAHPELNEVALDFLKFKMKNLNKRPMAFNGALIERKEHESPESRCNHKIKMASICCECGSLVKSPLKRRGISTSELKIH